ncbi:MAG TPA: PQQ-like beta-propeller repeat protein [Candidatus Hydrogenedentes bacterium]|nr:PQQ-like beta-propeller repeat protein [Candidatus Hydrogenedentota bacterium]HOV73420.1 PQQ-like beta-propeller repeat protein [Candidatus Hydrogenedentota bacterium]HPC17822.1 PQQ-like beta-propeller repeat protein [Candidatus Hydrogenedentota bacterium]HRT20663.1 PQQ-like beta-propeller repeat protein [Candidatus Hydrogenedentota bacterium]HRT65699.1 PQQ-like beta-propeller repeat protein [Candidatus Hydrogenedentota bacterium]
MTTRACSGLPLFCILLVWAMSSVAVCDNARDYWPQWRGPDLNGVSRAQNLPETWSETENIVWKTHLPSWSGSTPIVWGHRVFAASPSEPESGQSEGGSRLLLVCLAQEDGRPLWIRDLDSGNQLQHKQNMSSPSPVTDGTHVWVMTGTGTVAALTMDGDVVWKFNLQKEYGPFGLNFGYGSSPLLYNGKLFVQVLHGYTTTAPSYVMAFEGLTGKVLWRVERPTTARGESHDAYTTPTLVANDGKTQIVVSGGDYVTGHDPETGAEVWRAAGLNPRNSTRNRIIVSPVAVDGIVYACSSRRPLLALRGGGTGDVTASHLAWTWDASGGPDVPTPVCDGRHLYMVADQGAATCLDAKTGAVVYSPTRTAKGIVSASPVLADGKIYITNEDGVTTVLAAGPEFKILATNALPSEGKTLSSPAVSEGRIYLRTPTHLYCIGKKPGGG